MKAKLTGAALLLAMAAWAAGCESSAQTGTLLGTGLGAAAGQAIGGNTESTLIGGALGAGAGYIIGNEKDKAEARTAAPPVVVLDAPPQPIIVTQAPPTVVIEQRPAYPGPGYVWVDGYWAWSGGGYAWQQGYWVAPPRPSVIWIQPRYERHDRSHYRYTPGHWRRR